MELQPLILINAVGLTRKLLEHAPRLEQLAASGWVRSLEESLPAVTCTAQASILTGQAPRGHGIVANGWLFRDTREIRFWQQSNTLLQAEPIYTTARHRARERGRTFRAAKLFWWFNQGADVAISVTPKPYYGCDGNKVFGIAGSPDGLCERLESSLGRFPFHTFWGPGAGLPCTDWIARSAASIVERERPDLTLVYLPHLDYDPQRFGPSGCDMPRLVRELDDACAPLLDAASGVGARVWVVSEYGHCDVSRPILLNRVLRQAGLLTVRPVRSGRPSTRSAVRPSRSAIIRLPTFMWQMTTIAPGHETSWRRFPAWTVSWSGTSGPRSASIIHDPGTWWSWPGGTRGSPTPTGWMTAMLPISPRQWTSIASPDTTPASSS